MLVFSLLDKYIIDGQDFQAEKRTKPMKKMRTGVKIAVIAVLTFLAGLWVWDGFVMPAEGWSCQEILPAGTSASAESPAMPLQLQLLPWGSSYLIDRDQEVRGLALGYFLHQKNIDGVSVAISQTSGSRKRGVSLSMLELCGESTGLSMFIAGGSVKNQGVALGLWNLAEYNQGLQLGVVNQTRKDSILEYDMKPAYVNDKFGVQAGVVNYSEGRGIQIGLWNTNPKSFIKHFPLINFCF